MPHIDLNCDLAEGAPDDAAIIPSITSANVACGLHAGGPSDMRRTIAEARRHGVGVGAHPGFADRQGFGRADAHLSPAQIYDLVVYQVGALRGFLRRFGPGLQHVKAHGALYHLCARRADVADAFAAAALDAGSQVIIMGLPGTEMESAARRAGLPFAAEVFADRTYGEDGRLLPRSHPDALVAGDDAVIAARVVAMVRDQVIVTAAGAVIPHPAHTVCVHGDDPRAAGRAAAIRAALDAAGFTVAPLGSWLR